VSNDRSNEVCQAQARGARLRWCCFVLPLLVAIATVACGAPEGWTSPEPEGAAAMVVSALDIADATEVTVNVTGTGIEPPIVVALSEKRNEWSGLIGAIPPGTDRHFVVSAFDAAGNEIYRGEATLTVVAGQTVSIVVNARRTPSTPPKKNAAPVIDVLVASATYVAAGENVQLQVLAHDPNPGDVLTYAWSSRLGTFDTPTSSSTSWTAPASEGSERITIRVQDASAVATMSIDITVGPSGGRGKAAISATMNTWPLVEQVTVRPARIDVGQAVVFDVVAADADGDALSCGWSSDCDGVFDDVNARSPSFSLSALPVARSCTFTVVVTDGRGGEGTGTLTVPAGPAPAVEVAPAATGS
jgi:hypothetical protein